jgi:hypothetical protein
MSKKYTEQEVVCLYSQNGDEKLIRILAQKIKRFVNESASIDIRQGKDDGGDNISIVLLNATKMEREKSEGLCLGYLYGLTKEFYDEIYKG